MRCRVIDTVSLSGTWAFLCVKEAADPDLGIAEEGIWSWCSSAVAAQLPNEWYSVEQCMDDIQQFNRKQPGIALLMEDGTLIPREMLLP